EMTSVIRQPVNGERPIDDFFQTQQQLLRSRPIVVKAIQDLRLWDSPQFKRPLDVAATEEEISRAGLIDQFLLHLTVTAVPGTRSEDATSAHCDPALAKHAANALTANFKGEQAASQGQDSSNLMGWINDRLSEQRARVVSSEAALQAYMASHDAVSVE